MLQKNETIQPSSRLLNAVKRQLDGGLASPDSLDSLDNGRKNAIKRIFSSLQVTGEQFRSSGDWQVGFEPRSRDEVPNKGVHPYTKALAITNTNKTVALGGLTIPSYWEVGI